MGDKIIQNNEEKVRKNLEKMQSDKLNEIKNSIYEKQNIEFEREIIDFGFIPISYPGRGTEDPTALIFAMHGDNDDAIIRVTDMRGELLVEEVIDNCQVQILLPNVHFEDIFTGIL